MKLLYITNGINGAGGLERVLSIKASYLAEILGYEVHILVLNHNSKPLFYDFSERIILHDIPVSGNIYQYSKSYITGIKKCVQDINPSLISVCDDGLKGFFLSLFFKEKIPIIYERHASIKHNTSNGIKGKIMRFVMKKLAPKFDKFIVLTQSNKQEWNTKNCLVIPNPLSFYPLESSDLESHKVIVVGTHSHLKGYDLLLQAWQKITSKHPTWSLNIYGKIDSNSTFIKLSEAMNIQETVHFFQPINDIKSAYLSASMLVLSSRTEGFGMVLIEAMACGLPCVSFDCPSGPKDIINDKEDGFLIENENSNQLAEKILLLIEDTTLRKNMGSKAKQNVMRYLPEPIMTQWDNLFKEILR